MKKPKIYKVLVAGPPDAGKTTFVRTCSQISPLNTDVKGESRSTTVALDFGLIRLSEESEIHIYGTPGQERFSFMWEILNKGAIGCIYLIPAYGYDLFHLASHYRQLRNVIDLPMVFGITKTDLNSENSDIIFHIFKTFNLSKEDVFTLDPRIKEDVKGALLKIVKKAIDMIEEGKRD
jgi:hypothetical protein